MLSNLDVKKAQEAQAALREAGKDLRKDFDDQAFWLELARDKGVKLPAWYLPCDKKYMGRWFRQLKVTKREYLETTGFSELEEFQQLNSDWPLRAWVGLLLEYVNERDQAKENFKMVAGKD